MIVHTVLELTGVADRKVAIGMMRPVTTGGMKMGILYRGVQRGTSTTAHLHKFQICLGGCLSCRFSRRGRILIDSLVDTQCSNSNIYNRSGIVATKLDLSLLVLSGAGGPRGRH